MLTRMSLAAAILFSFSLEAAPSCRALSESLLRFPPAKISERAMEQLIDGTAWGLKLTASLKPGRANFIFILGNIELLPVSKIQITMPTNFIKGEHVPRVAKDVLTVTLVSPEPGGMAFSMMELPPEAFHPSRRILMETPQRKTPSTLGIHSEFSYQNGILTYVSQRQYVYTRRSMFGLKRERFEIEKTIVKLEVDETLTRFGRVEFIQRTEKPDGTLISVNSLESVGDYAADVAGSGRYGQIEQINPADAALFGAINDYVSR